MDLAKRLIKAGSPDRKFMRMIHVQADVTAPLYWWKEYDTYKVGTVANSCSTMHTLHKRDLTIDDFSHEHLDDTFGKTALIETIRVINNARAYYNESKSKEDWYAMIQLLPSSFNQMRTIDLDYETLKKLKDNDCVYILGDEGLEGVLLSPKEYKRLVGVEEDLKDVLMQIAISN